MLTEQKTTKSNPTVPVWDGKICNFPFTANNILEVNPSAENFNSPLGRMLKSGDISHWVYLCTYLFLRHSRCSKALQQRMHLWSSCSVWRGFYPGNDGHQGWREPWSGFCKVTFPGLNDYTALSCFVFQRLRALEFQLKFIWFANCLHVRKGEHAISFHCNLKSHN